MDIPPPVPSPDSSGQSSSFLNDNQWAVILHLSGLVGLAFPAIGNWAAPLIIWLLKRSDSPTLDNVGKEAVNFQLSYTLYTLVFGSIIGILCFLVVGFILLPLLGVLWLAWIILMIVAAVKASSGEFYRYPGIIRFIR